MSQRLGRARGEGVRRGVLTVIRRSTVAANWILVLLVVPPPFRADRGQWRQRAPRRNEETSLFAMRRSSLLIKARVQALRRGCIPCDAELEGWPYNLWLRCGSSLQRQPILLSRKHSRWSFAISVTLVDGKRPNTVDRRALPEGVCLGQERGNTVGNDRSLRWLRSGLWVVGGAFAMGAMLAYLTNWEIGTLSGLAVAVVLLFVSGSTDGKSGIPEEEDLADELRTGLRCGNHPGNVLKSD